jgi:cytochrome c-type biogenesis protein CcmH/NrfF
MLPPAFYEIKGRNLKDLVRDIYNLIKSIVVSIYNFFVGAYNKILHTKLSVNWKTFWWCIGIIFVLGLVITVYAKVKKRRRHKKPSATESRQKAKASKDVDRSETLFCWKCHKSVPVAEYSAHVDKCFLQKPQFRV